MELLKNAGINKNAIELDEGKQPLYNSIYNLGLVELEILKAYIETYLKTGFIWPSKASASAHIFFDKKSDGSLHLYVNYRDFNNLMIKNCYLLSLIGHTKQFIQLDPTNTYYQIIIQESDKCKTAFCTRYSQFAYQVMPFGMSNTSASF